MARKLVHLQSRDRRHRWIRVVQSPSCPTLGPHLIISLMVKHRVTDSFLLLNSSLILLLLLPRWGSGLLIVIFAPATVIFNELASKIDGLLRPFNSVLSIQFRYLLLFKLLLLLQVAHQTV